MKIINFIKREIVLCVAIILAIISSFIIKPDGEYIEYIDFRTLGILLSLMTVMAGFQKIGVFTCIAKLLLRKVNTYKSLLFILTMLCFVSSMLITNDVALITFVPFTIIVLSYLPKEDECRFFVPVIVMQTIAANLGSMFTPIGNPQNLYLYGKANISMGRFMLLMLPYTLIAFVLITMWCIRKGGSKQCEVKLLLENENNDDLVFTKQEKISLIVYILLFAVNLLTVMHVIPYTHTLLIVIIAVLIIDKKILLHVDYLLLLTFIGFFVFIGNIGRIPYINDFLCNVVRGNEVVVSTVLSQVVSNVPAALLLSNFTSDYEGLIIGTNLGGLGTLIASMASLISYKYVVREKASVKGEYVKKFTFANVVFLIVLMLGHFVMNFSDFGI